MAKQMKNEPIFPLALGLMCLLSLSCQKTKIESTGLFTQWEKQLQHQRLRAPASVEPQAAAAPQSSRDVKQVYLYCHALWDSENKIKKCFEKNIGVSLSASDSNWEQTQRDVFGLLESMMTKIRPKLSDKVDKRVEFCNRNSSVDFKRCLYQYHQQEAVGLLNDFHTNYPQLNGHEYLFLKKRIMENLGQELALRFDHHKSVKKKSLNRQL